MRFVSGGGGVISGHVRTNGWERFEIERVEPVEEKASIATTLDAGGVELPATVKLVHEMIEMPAASATGGTDRVSESSSSDCVVFVIGVAVKVNASVFAVNGAVRVETKRAAIVMSASFASS